MRKKTKRRWNNTKLGKATFLATDCLLQPFVPDTRRATLESVELMLNEYGMVYVKPTVGSGGRGIFRVWMQKGEDERPAAYHFQRGKTTQSFACYAEMYKAMKVLMGPKSHVVQKGIDLLHYEDRPFDVRVMVQKNEISRWEPTGIIGRVAHPAKVVTNYHNGGTPMPMEQLLEHHIEDKEQRDAFIAEMNRLGLQIARHMQSGYRWVTEVGIDFGIDSEMKPWVLEVNTIPDPYIFRSLADKSMFRKIVRCRKIHGKPPLMP